MKTRSFNTNNQKCKKKQVQTNKQTNKQTLIFEAPITFSQGDLDEVRNKNQTRIN